MYYNPIYLWLGNKAIIFVTGSDWINNYQPIHSIVEVV